MSQSYDCPNCGGAVPFQSSIAVFAVCPHCRSMVVRHDVKVATLGLMAELPPDLSPLQIGTTGEFDGAGFTLIGRARMAYDEGSWNEWCALFGDGRHGWAAEAQGFFMVSFETQLPEGFPTGAGGLPVGHRIEIAGQSYSVTDREESLCLGSEGELPFIASPNRKALSIDLTSLTGLFAGVEFADDGTRLFLGRYARFDDLKFANLRAVPGWSDDSAEPTRRQTTALSCPKCGATVNLRAAGFTMSATCGSCGSLIDTATPDLQLIQAAQEKQRITPQIPLGQRGVLAGVNYEVIGFQHVKDDDSGWSEYLLFNPWQGFIWLVNYNGHWTVARRLFERPEADESEARFEGGTYRIFAAGTVTTVYVIGEFYWKVAVGMPVTVTDFVNPPRILSRETYRKSTEETWSQGEYAEPQVIQQAFNIAQPLREPVGVYLNQPNPHAEKVRQLKWLVPMFIGVLLLTQIVSALRAAHQPVFNAAYTYHAGATNPVVVSEPFELKGGNQAVEFQLYSPVDNNWIELDIDLVNAETHLVAATCEQVVEYYHGYDGGPWSEGKQTERAVVPAVAPGKYYLAIDVSADPAVKDKPFTVRLVRDVMIWSNFWIALVLLLIYPLYRWTRSYAFERARWVDSDYAPALYAGKSDD